MSLFGIILVRIFPHSDWIWRDTPYSVRVWKILRISPYSVRTRENVDRNNSEYGHFSRSQSATCFWLILKTFSISFRWNLLLILKKSRNSFQSIHSISLCWKKRVGENWLTMKQASRKNEKIEENFSITCKNVLPFSPAYFSPGNVYFLSAVRCIIVIVY